MAIYYQPPPPFIGGTQPLAPHPGNIAAEAFVPAVSSTPAGNYAVTVQQQPPSVAPVVFAGNPPAIGAAPTRNTAVVAQEQPQHPPPVTVAGPQPNTGVQPGRRQEFVRQEQPPHPGPTVFAGNQPAIGAAPVKNTVFTTQERPDLSTRSWLASGFPSTRVASPSPPTATPMRFGSHRDTYAQLAPGFQWTQRGVPTSGPAPVPPLARTLTTVQEQPAHPGPVTFAGRTPAIGASPTRNSAITAQEQPPSTTSVTVSGVLDTPTVATYGVANAPMSSAWDDVGFSPILNSKLVQTSSPFIPALVNNVAITAQALPPVSSLWLQQGVPPVAATVAPPVRGFAFVTQQQPDQPRSSVQFLRPIPPTFSPPGGSFALLPPQQPPAPTSITWQGVAPISIVPPPVVVPVSTPGPSDGEHDGEWDDEYQRRIRSDFEARKRRRERRALEPTDDDRKMVAELVLQAAQMKLAQEEDDDDAISLLLDF